MGYSVITGCINYFESLCLIKEIMIVTSISKVSDRRYVLPPWSLWLVVHVCVCGGGGGGGGARHASGSLL